MHSYELQVEWTGNAGSGTRTYTAYRRDHEIRAAGKPVLAGSSDPAFRGDPARYNPEELLVASASACHMLWYLHLCAENGIVVTAYLDAPCGTLDVADDGSGAFREIELRPRVTLAAPADVARAFELHAEAHRKCFIAASLGCPVTCVPVFEQAG